MRNDNLFPSTNPVSVLDFGFVRLVDYMGDDLSIVRSARVSYNADWREGDDTGSDRKLIAYLLKNQHFSPFESVNFTFEIKCPIFIARQWHRHWSWRFNEVSARYTELPDQYYVPKLEHITQQSKDNKQGRTNEIHPHAEQMQVWIDSTCATAFQFYKDLLAKGCPRELARGVLPLNTYTRFFGTVNLRSIIHFIGLRDEPHAQWEIQQYGRALKHLVRLVTPVTAEILYGS